jgi:membrane protease YdiL (CAAX protease family)
LTLSPIQIQSNLPSLEPATIEENRDSTRPSSIFFVSDPVYQIAMGYFLSPIVSGIEGFITQGLLTHAFKKYTLMSLRPLSSSIDKMSFICISGPVIEELIFRRYLFDNLKTCFIDFYNYLGINSSLSSILAKISTIFVSAVIFGSAHFLNAYSLGCSFNSLLPQVVYCTVGGLLYGFLKEYTGDIYVSIGLHVGNNVDAWTSSAWVELAKLVQS